MLSDLEPLATARILDKLRGYGTTSFEPVQLTPSGKVITIPLAIDAIPGLDLVEKILLSCVEKYPHGTNERLSALTGLSVRGVQAALARLRKRNHIGTDGRARARRMWVV